MNLAELQPRLPAVLRAIFNCFPAQRSLPSSQGCLTEASGQLPGEVSSANAGSPPPTLLKLSPYSMELNRAIENSSKSSQCPQA